MMQFRGFTLIESVIVIALGACMMVAIAVLAFHFNGTVSYQQAIAQSSGSASAVMREIELFTLPSSAVLETHSFSDSSYTSSSTVLVLEVPSIDSSNNSIANAYDYAAFYTDGTNAYRLLEANTLSRRASGTKKLSSTIHTLTFAYDSVDFAEVKMITVDVQTQALIKQDVLSDHRNERIRLRNR